MLCSFCKYAVTREGPLIPVPVFFQEPCLLVFYQP